jgi:hypothetical protein
MVNTRPSPKKLAALKFEIAKRYKRAAADARKRNRSRGMAAIRLSELTRWLDDAFGKGVELEPGEASYQLVRIFAHHLGGLPDTARRITVWCATYAPWISPRDLERLITEVTDCPLKWTADKLAWKIKLNDATRTRLKIRTIGAIDCNREQREARRKANRATRDAARYQRKRACSPSI